MRENKYLTMMDPFQIKYGNVLSSALIIPALVADVLWVARTLVSLGKTPHPGLPRAVVAVAVAYATTGNASAGRRW